jgi:hypothetical protein
VAARLTTMRDDAEETLWKEAGASVTVHLQERLEG